MEGLPKEIIWKMSEGAPETKTDVTSKGEKLNQVLVKFIDEPTDNNNPERV